jgi:hypothetical protein
LNPTRPKAEPEEAKFDIRILALAVRVFAVNDFGFGRMHFQMAFGQSGLKLKLQDLCFLLGTAVYQSVIRIPTPWEVRVCPCHPEIKRVMHEEVGQDRAKHAPYTKGNFQFERIIRGWRTRYPLLDLRLKR